MTKEQIEIAIRMLEEARVSLSIASSEDELVAADWLFEAGALYHPESILKILREKLRAAS